MFNKGISRMQQSNNPRDVEVMTALKEFRSLHAKDPKAPNAATDKEPPRKIWPSDRVAPGGFFHAPKREYSKETAEMLDVLMKESRMSMQMRKNIQEALRKGESLKPEPLSIDRNGDPEKNAQVVLKHAQKEKRKSLNKMLSKSSGFVPREPSNKAKQEVEKALADIRSSKTNLKKKPVFRSGPNAETQDIIDELMDQINERAEWLAELEELGEANPYREEIRKQITDRLRHVKALEVKIRVQKEGIRYID